MSINWISGVSDDFDDEVLKTVHAFENMSSDADSEQGDYEQFSESSSYSQKENNDTSNTRNKSSGIQHLIFDILCHWFEWIRRMIIWIFCEL